MAMLHEEYLLTIADADRRLGIFLALPLFVLCSNRDHSSGENESTLKLGQGLEG